MNQLLSTGFDKALRFSRDYKYELLGGTAVAGLLIGLYKWRQTKLLPPGPLGVPLIGSSLILKENLSDILEKLQQDYGDIVCVGTGLGGHMIILNTYSLVKEAYNDRGTDFMDRQPSNLSHFDLEDELFSIPGFEKHKENKKFYSKCLRSAGFAKSGFDERFKTEWEDLEKMFASFEGKPFDPQSYFRQVFANVIQAIMFDRRYSLDDKEVDTFPDLVQNFYNGAMTEDSMFLPKFLQRLMSDDRLCPSERAKKGEEKFTSHIMEIIKEHERTYDANVSRDFVDVCLKEGVVERKGYRHLAHICIGFTADAIHTMGMCMMYMLLYLINYPEHQERIRKEVQSVSTSGDVTTNQKKDEMPFTEAFINEVMRHASPVAIMFENSPRETTTLNGYRILKTDKIFANLHYIHHDPRTWVDPNRFDPTRFLDKDGKFKRYDEIIPFGLGRRRCMGEQLAKSELFFFTANMVRCFELSPVDANNPPDVAPAETYGLRANKPFEMVVKRV